MADRFIDQDETQIYGPYASSKIRKKVIGLIPAFDPALQHLAGELDAATAAVQAAITAARDKDSSLRQGVRQKAPALKQALALLGRFSKHLDGHPQGAVDKKVFFTTDGTASGVGKSAMRVLLAVTHITGKLKLPATVVSDRDAWAKEFESTMAQLGPVVEHADSARTDRRDLTPEVEAARQAWMQTYLAVRDGVASVYRLTGKLDRLSGVFYDLAVPATAKVTAPPPEEPEEVEEAEAAEESDEPETPRRA